MVHSPRILVVDDDEPLRAMVTRMLESAGYDVRQSTDGVAVAAALQHESVDLILSDISMPRRGGVETLIEVRKDHPLLPVVFMTGVFPTDSGPLFDLAHALGVRHLMQKPFTQEDLLGAVADGLSEVTGGASAAPTEMQPGVFFVKPRPWIATEAAIALTRSDYAAYLLEDPLSTAELAAAVPGSVLLIDVDEPATGWPAIIRRIHERVAVRIGVISSHERSAVFEELQRAGHLELGYLQLEGDPSENLNALRDVVRTAEVPRRSRGLRVACTNTQGVLAHGDASRPVAVTEISATGFTCLVDEATEFKPGTEIGRISIDLGPEDLGCSGTVGRIRMGVPVELSITFDRPLSPHEEELVRGFMLNRLRSGAERHIGTMLWRHGAELLLAGPLRRLEWGLLGGLAGFLTLLVSLLV